MTCEASQNKRLAQRVYATGRDRSRVNPTIVDIFRGYLKRLRHVHLLFFKKLFCYETLWGKRNPDFFPQKSDFFSRKSDFFYRKSEFFIENPIFFSQKSGSFSKTYKIRGVVLVHILLFENIRNPVFGHFPSFPASSFMPRVTYLQYLTQCGVKPGLYSVRRSTQTANESTRIRA